MNTPFFSIVIPTRNRYETLLYSIRTVLEQDFSSFELIISDNSDQEICTQRQFSNEHKDDRRVKYFRPPQVMAMSDHWEFALSKVSGQFIIVFGDDDGLVKGALSKIYNIIQETNARLVSWARIEYSWPDRQPLEHANLITIPYNHSTGIVNSKTYIKKILSYKADYRYLPMFYNSAVSKETINLLKQKTGRIFNAASPDIYTGYAFAHLLKNYISIGQPLSINGVSSKSNGAAHLINDESVKKDYWKTFQSSSIKWPTSIPEINNVYLGVIEPFTQLKNYFPELESYISRKEIYKIIIDKLESIDEDDLKKKKEVILKSARNDKKFYHWVEKYIQKKNAKYPSAVFNGKSNEIGFNGANLVLDASKFGLKNVYDVSIFIADLFGPLKDKNFLKPAELTFTDRAKKAAGILLYGV
ncbi:MAG TPA: glycosyltransferase family 2 protein [Puia sp.]|nr:glycosyltransferase family 2 protein [Puia sp.]